MRRSLLAVVLAACSPPADDSTSSATTAAPGDTGTSTADLPTTGGDGTSSSTSTTGDPDDSSTGGATGTDGTTGTTGTTGEPFVPGCPEGDVVLVDQADVPLYAGCTDFPGDLTVLHDVVDLAPLAGVRTVAGTLMLGTYSYGSSLTTLDAFTDLESVGGLEVISASVPDLLAFSNLTEIPGDLSIFGLPVPTLEGLHNLTTVGGEVRVSISGITDLTGLRGLQRAGGLLLSHLTIPDFHGLEALTDLGIAGGEPAGFRLATMTVTSLDGLNIAWHDANDVWIYDTPITDLGDLAGVPELHGLELNDNDALTTLAGLESLDRIGGTLKIYSNGALVDFTGLAGLESIGTLELVGGQLADLSAFTSLQTIGALHVRSYPGTDLAPPPALQQIDAATFFSNDDLTGLSILAGVTSLTALSLEMNPDLSDLSDLSDLVEVTGDLDIRDNAALPALTDLAALQTVGGRLAVVLNPSLPQIDAVAWGDAIAVGGVRKIAGNKDPGPPLDPCPWFEDGECDEPINGSGICGEDLDGGDCCPGACE